MKLENKWIAVLDFGSQYTQLIARRIRELSIYSEIFPFNIPFDDLMSYKPAGLILSGGPDSVYINKAPHPDPRILEAGIPVLGICYGFHLIAEMMGGEVLSSTRREYGHASLEITSNSQLLNNLGQIQNVWMSHGDKVDKLPSDFIITASTNNAEIGAIENKKSRMYGIQFHPEVHHTPKGIEIFKNFLCQVYLVIIIYAKPCIRYFDNSLWGRQPF